MFHHAQNYPLIPTVKNGTRLHPQHNLYLEEYTRSTYDLYMTRELVRNEYNEVRGFYRLHAKTPHTRECIIVCVKAKFVDTVRARSGHPIGGFIPTWQNAK